MFSKNEKFRYWAKMLGLFFVTDQKHLIVSGIVVYCTNLENMELRVTYWLGLSLINNKNKRGPYMEPWGTPALMEFQVE
jgi:uncharacterized membrane protein